MGKIAIQVEGLSKQYYLGGVQARYQTIRESITNTLVRPMRWIKNRQDKSVTKPEAIWALKDVSFEVKRGDVVGIIGRNGAGKSTLLKILSRITHPTSGRAKVYGRVGSLLEVGTGFHPELTGRENIYLNGTILGMRRAEIVCKFDEIVSFAEIEKFLDTPVKHYSSGMYVRLAFAVAAYLEPEILLVDEVLAVGDAAFQRKCLGRMGEVAREGRTVLFVSHNLSAVRSLCNRCNLFDSGELSFTGDVNECINRYLSEINNNSPTEIETALLKRPTIVADASLRIKRVKLDTVNQQAVIESGQPIKVAMQFSTEQPLSDVVFGLTIETVDSIRILDCRSTDTFGPISKLLPGTYIIQCELNQNILSPGIYNLSVGARCAAKGLDYLPNVLMFEIFNTKRYESLWLEARSGLVHLESSWNFLDWEANSRYSD